jgi:hypothetical protein
MELNNGLPSTQMMLAVVGKSRRRKKGRYNPEEVLQACIDLQAFLVSPEAIAASIMLDILQREIELCWNNVGLPRFVYNGGGLCEVLTEWGDGDDEADSAHKVAVNVQKVILTLADQDPANPPTKVTPTNIAQYLKCEIARIWSEQAKPRKVDIDDLL